MTCLGSYALPYEYASFWCASGYASRIHEGAGPVDAVLVDSMADFVNMGIKPNVGMLLYNVTKNTSGFVTAVTATTLTATGVVWANGDVYRIAAISAAEQATIQMYLNITAADINAALAATNSCDCTFQDWALPYLAKLNIIEAGAFHTCSCGSPRLDNDMRRNLLEWAGIQLDNLRDGKVIVCAGDSGKEYPAVGWAEINHTIWSEAEIIENYLKRQP